MEKVQRIFSHLIIVMLTSSPAIIGQETDATNQLKARALLDWAGKTGDTEVKRNLVQAEKVFKALRDKNWDLLSEVMPEDHIQHAPGIPTGRQGLIEFFSRLPDKSNTR